MSLDEKENLAFILFQFDNGESPKGEVFSTTFELESFPDLAAVVRKYVPELITNGNKRYQEISVQDVPNTPLDVEDDYEDSIEEEISVQDVPNTLLDDTLLDVEDDYEDSIEESQDLDRNRENITSMEHRERFYKIDLN
eukprot:GHVP01019374.1.p1 GENE.GHVP01019374.1~~GHVP01019374.1.p1  ORF type:complete len:139 (-),score=28.56 GHVP01019374.1:380-796(-)